MKKNLKFVVDSDALIALMNPEDDLHLQAISIIRDVMELDIELLFPTTMITETCTYFQRVMSNKEGAEFILDHLKKNYISIVPVDERVLLHSADAFTLHKSKQDTLYDCIVASIALFEKADAIFSFDKFYSKIGFLLAKDFLKKQVA